MNRIKWALKFNEPQRMVMCWMTLMTVMAVAARAEPAPMWAYGVALLFWPVSIFVMNVWHPLPASAFRK